MIERERCIKIEPNNGFRLRGHDELKGRNGCGALRGQDGLREHNELTGCYGCGRLRGCDELRVHNRCGGLRGYVGLKAWGCDELKGRNKCGGLRRHDGLRGCDGLRGRDASNKFRAMVQNRAAVRESATMVAATVDQKNATEVGDPESAPATVVAEVNAKEMAAEMCRVELFRA